MENEFVKRKTFSRKNNLFFIGIILYVGVSPIIDYFIPLRIIGMSFFITALPFFLLFYLFINNINKIDSLTLGRLVLLTFFFILVILLRALIFDISLQSSFGGSFYIFYIVIIICLLNLLDFNELNVKKVKQYFLIIFFIHFFNSLFYILGYYNIQLVDVNSEDYVKDSRFVGLMAGANVQAALFTAILTSLILVFNQKRSVALIFLMLGVIAIIPTLSRGAILIVILLFLKISYDFFFKTTLINKIGTLIIVACIIVFVINNVDFTFLDLYFNSLSNRLDQDDQSGDRINRFVSTFHQVFTSVPQFIFGISPSNIVKSNISDNSLTLLISNFGIPFSIFYIFLIKKILVKTSQKTVNTKFFILLFFLTILTNNSVLWMFWIIFISFAYYIAIYLNTKSYKNEIH